MILSMHRATAFAESHATACADCGAPAGGNLRSKRRNIARPSEPKRVLKN